MKVKTGFALHTLGNEYVVVPVGERTKDFHGMVRMNKSGAFLWEQMKGDFTKENLVNALLDHYEITNEVAEKTVETFITKLMAGGMLEE